MIRTSYLRVYRPVSDLLPPERRRWQSYDADDNAVEAALTRRWLISGRLPAPDHAWHDADGAFVKKVGDDVYVCPWHTRLRMLTSLLAFRGSMPDEIADAFVAESEARKAADELVALERTNPELRSHILHANWHVPLRWFAAFGDDERILTEDRLGLRVRYETKLGEAGARLERAIRILEGAWIDDDIVGALRNLAEWVASFGEGCLLELDYGTVAGMFPDDELVDDHTAGQVWDCLGALAAGDIVEAGRLFGEMTDRWSEARSLEVAN